MKKMQSTSVQMATVAILLFSLPVSAATPAPEGYLDAAKMAQAPFDSRDATAALQAAVRSGAPRIWVPNMGAPWLIDTVHLASDQEILFEDGG